MELVEDLHDVAVAPTLWRWNQKAEPHMVRPTRDEAWMYSATSEAGPRRTLNSVLDIHPMGDGGSGNHRAERHVKRGSSSPGLGAFERCRPHLDLALIDRARNELGAEIGEWEMRCDMALTSLPPPLP
jgi:hypothetical protein